MTTAHQLVTERLLLRAFEDRDRAPFSAMNADAAVMTYFASPMTAEESDAAIERYAAARERNGFSFFAAEVRETGEFAGLIGLQVMRDVVPNLPQPAVEIGWRLACEHQGKGFATEGARAVVNFAFHELKLTEVVAITAVSNAASRNVMEKLGMQLQPQLEFDHPRMNAEHPHRRHVLYRLTNPDAPGRTARDEEADEQGAGGPRAHAALAQGLSASYPCGLTGEAFRADRAGEHRSPVSRTEDDVHQDTRRRLRHASEYNAPGFSAGLQPASNNTMLNRYRCVDGLSVPVVPRRKAA